MTSFVLPFWAYWLKKDMKVKAILFDKDGTLLDFNATFAPATAHVLKDVSSGSNVNAETLAQSVGFDLPTQTIAEDSVLIAGSLENIADHLFEYSNENDKSVFLETLNLLYIKYSKDSLTAFPFTQQALKSLQRMNIPLGVATNDSESAAKSHLEVLGLTGYFQYVAGYDSGYGEKPMPGMVTGFAKSLGIEPNEMMMVGDSTHDLTAARRAHAISIGVTSGLATQSDLQPLADHVLNDVSELPNLVEQINLGRG